MVCPIKIGKGHRDRQFLLPLPSGERSSRNHAFKYVAETFADTLRRNGSLLRIRLRARFASPIRQRGCSEQTFPVITSIDRRLHVFCSVNVP